MSDPATALPEPAATEPTTPADPGQGAPPAEPATPEPQSGSVQPTDPGTEAQPPAGQDLIAPYLEGVDEAHRDIVAERLEKYRKDSDANVTRTFEQLNSFKQYAEDPQQLEVPVTLYENLMDKPAETIKWVIDRFQTEAGLDLKSQLKEMLSEEPATPAPEPPGDGTDPNDPNRPLTYAEWQRLQEEQKQAQQQEAARQEQTKTVNGWLANSAKKHNLTIGEEDAALKEAILKQAAQLMPQFKQFGDEAGQKAVDTAVEAFVNRFGSKQATPTDPPPEPKIADGGTPPAPPEETLEDPAARKAFMRRMLTAPSQE